MRIAALLFLIPFLWQFNNDYSSSTYTGACDTTNANICILSGKAAQAATLLAQTSNYASAIALIKKAQSTYYKEYVISFGRDSAGNLVNSQVSTGNINSGYIPGIQNRFADIHIHTNEQPPSSGDLYGFIDQAITAPHYIRYIITPVGTAYALILINKEEALNFNTLYARRAGIKHIQPDGTSVNYQPTFPQQLVDEFNELISWSHASREAALVFLLKKYKTGIALLKQNTSGIYKALDVIEKTDSKGHTTYLLSYCP
ncbi:hypothetical protein ACTJIJ_12640 [Niabella sp. 22666]|uniref:hypothetical protein n=1 Tax=Niabella sp. 22666 TaxID=3453954 RepID=UPI003F8373DD